MIKQIGICLIVAAQFALALPAQASGSQESIDAFHAQQKRNREAPARAKAEAAARATAEEKNTANYYRQLYAGRLDGLSDKEAIAKGKKITADQDIANKETMKKTRANIAALQIPKEALAFMSPKERAELEKMIADAKAGK